MKTQLVELDLYIRDNIEQDKYKPLVDVLKLHGARFIGMGHLLNYRNWVGRITQKGLNHLTKVVKDTNGVYVNTYPPEIQAEMDAEVDCEYS